jgi:hypothetical protein
VINELEERSVEIHRKCFEHFWLMILVLYDILMDYVMFPKRAIKSEAIVIELHQFGVFDGDEIISRISCFFASTFQLF